MPMIEVPPSEQFPGMTGRYQPTLDDTEFKAPSPKPPTYGDESTVLGGAAAGAVGGAIVGGPIGAVVGGGIGAAAGGFLAAPPAVQQGALYNNDVARAFRLLSQPTFAPDPKYDVSQDADVIGADSKYQRYLNSFVGSQSRAETQSIMSGIDRQNAADKAVQDGGWLGILAQAASGAASPMTLLPIGGIIGAAADVGKTALVLRSVAEAAVLGGVYGAASGTLNQATNPNATSQDTIAQTILGAALTGVLGGAASLLTRSELNALREGLTSLPSEAASEVGVLGAEQAIQNPLDAVGINSRLATAGVAEADRPDFAAAYARVAAQYEASTAELEAIRLEAGQPQTAPEYIAETARLVEQRDREIASLETILHEYPATEATPGIRPAEQGALGGTVFEPVAERAAEPATPRTVSEATASETVPLSIVQNAEAATEAASTAARGTSKIGTSIETKAVDARLTNGFDGTAGYDKITIKDQAERATNLVNSDLANARAIVRGDKPLPSGLHGTSLITAMEEYLAKNPSAAIAHELANSPLVSATSAAAQSLRLAAERAPDSIAARFQAIKDARVAAIAKRTGTGAVQKAVKDIRGSIVSSASKRPSWESFIKSVQCA